MNSHNSNTTLQLWLKRYSIRCQNLSELLLSLPSHHSVLPLDQCWEAFFQPQLYFPSHISQSALPNSLALRSAYFQYKKADFIIILMNWGPFAFFLPFFSLQITAAPHLSPDPPQKNSVCYFQWKNYYRFRKWDSTAMQIIFSVKINSAWVGLSHDGNIALRSFNNCVIFVHICKKENIFFLGHSDEMKTHLLIHIIFVS